MTPQVAGAAKGAGGGITGGSEAERPENVRAHTYTQTPNTQPRGLDWRIHCGVEVTELSTNKQLSLSFLDKILLFWTPISLDDERNLIGLTVSSRTLFLSLPPSLSLSLSVQDDRFAPS
jgi:hypothetical protein